MLARSKLRNDPAERLMHIDLRRDDRRKNLTPVPYYSRRGLITRCLYPQNQHTSTVSRVRSFRQSTAPYRTNLRVLKFQISNFKFQIGTHAANWRTCGFTVRRERRGLGQEAFSCSILVSCA